MVLPGRDPEGGGGEEFVGAEPPPASLSATPRYEQKWGPLLHIRHRLRTALHALGVEVSEPEFEDYERMLVKLETLAAEGSAAKRALRTQLPPAVMAPASSMLDEIDDMRAAWINAVWKVIAAARPLGVPELQKAVAAFEAAESKLERYHSRELIDMLRPTKGGGA